MLIPEGFSTITPYFFVKDAELFIAFLKDAFEGQETLRSIRKDGRVANCQVRIGTSTIMVSESSDAYPAMASSFYIYVESADQSLARALKAGAKLEMNISDMPYGDRQGGVRDRFGNIWWISQRLVDGPYV